MRKKILVTFCTCVLLGLGIFAGTSYYASADTSKSYQDEIDAAKAKKEQLEKERKELEAKLAELQKQKDDMNAYIENMDKQYMELMYSIEELEADIEELEEELFGSNYKGIGAMAPEESVKNTAQLEKFYTYNKKNFQFMINGETGKIVGKYPVSGLKVTLVVLLAIALIVAAILYFG